MADEALKIRIAADVAQATTAIDKVGKSLSNLKPGTNQAALALSNLGRVAQDAPFGFIAIQNNLNPLLESFQRLKAESGSTGGALKALASSLTGAGGIGLALSIGTALFVTFGDTISKWASQIDQATQRQSEFKAAIDGAVAATQGEVVQVQSLVAIAGNEALSRGARTEALKKLQAEYPSYFANVKFDGKLTENLADATNKLTQAIILNAKAKAIQKQIDQSAERAATATTDPTSTITGLEAFGQALLDNVLLRTKEATAITLADRAIARSGKIVNQEATFQNKLAAELLKVNEALAAQGSLFDDKVKVTKVPKVKVKVDEVELQPAKVGILGGTFSKGVSGMADVAGKINTSLLNAFLPLQGSIKAPAVDELALKLQILSDKAEALAGNLTAMLGPAFQDLFATIISGGKNALANFGEAIKQIITKLISAAITAALFAAIVSVAFPGASAGGANFGKNFSSIFAAMGGIPKHAEGGIATKRHLGIVGEAGPEAIIPLNKLPGLIAQMQPVSASNLNIVGQISGTDIVLVNKRSGGQYGNTLSF
jgi:hypothetical protein